MLQRSDLRQRHSRGDPGDPSKAKPAICSISSHHHVVLVWDPVSSICWWCLKRLLACNSTFSLSASSLVQLDPRCLLFPCRTPPSSSQLALTRLKSTNPVEEPPHRSKITSRRPRYNRQISPCFSPRVSITALPQSFSSIPPPFRSHPLPPAWPPGIGPPLLTLIFWPEPSFGDLLAPSCQIVPVHLFAQMQIVCVCVCTYGDVTGGGSLCGIRYL